MRIRTQLVVSAVLAVALTLAAGMAVWWFVLQSRDADQERERAGAAARDTANLLVLTQEFALHFGERTEQQWQQRHASLGAMLHVAGNDQVDRETLDELRRVSAHLVPLFEQLAGLADAPESEFTQRRKEFLVDQLLTETQALVDGAYRWSRDAASAQRNSERNLEGAVIGALALMATLLLVQTAMLGRRVVGPVLRLQDATQAVERGESRVRVKGDASDEIGELNRRFNAMTDALAQRTEALAAEMALRQQAQALTQANEKRLVDITNNIPALIGYFDRDERCRFANGPALRIHGIARDDAHKHTLRSSLGEVNYALHVPHVAKVMKGERASFEGELIRKGKEVHYQAHLVPDLDEQGQVKGFYLMSFDITPMKLAEKARAAGEQRLRTITDNLPVLISYVDAERRLQFANATFKEWIGIDPDAVIGQHLHEVIGPALLGPRQGYLDRALKGERVSFEIVSEANGVRRHLQNVYVPDVQPDGSVAGLYALSSDVTAVKLVEQRLHELARVDELTGLPNRRQFEEKLAQAVARSRRESRPMALLFLDVDRFKQINDTHGHGVGDEVLKEFAQRLRRCVRLTDTVARLAGDEFVIILEGLRARPEAEQVAEKIGTVLSAKFGEAAKGLSVSSSIGVAFVDGQDVSPDEIIAKADKALYQAKRAGRATFAVSSWNPDDVGGASPSKPSTLH